MNQESDDFLAVRELLTFGNEFCYFVENQSKYEENYRLTFLQRALPALYLKGALLPEVTECDESYMQRYVTEENYEILFNEMREIFGKKDQFHTADEITGDLIKHSLSENLCDLYQDMKDLFMTFSKGYEAGRACTAFYAREWFDKRWGNAIVKALPIIHELMSDSSAGPDLE
ncbi:MAG: hypothetical protein C0592_02335 [Marinilabiliales bacterium]|nr:MAG: hypothetical protein C0592_02335 [Marinilabiliales bacterium]